MSWCSVPLPEMLVDAGISTGALNLVIGQRSVVGDTRVTQPSVDAIRFTGSDPVGRAIQLKATERGKRVQLELGGKDPAVVSPMQTLSRLICEWS